MVDKIDKPNPPPAYSVREPTESKGDKPHDQRRQEDLPTFKKKEEDLYREKFQSEPLSKTYRLAVGDIREILFVRATPRHGVPMADAELILQDGKKMAGVSFLLKNWQDFMKIKNLKTGQAVPLEFWNFGGTHLEITIKSVSTSGPWNLRTIEQQKIEKKIIPQEASLPWWKKRLVLYGLGGAIALAILLFLIFR